jgi:hypothetical protein
MFMVRRLLIFFMVLLAVGSSALADKKKSELPIVRWVEGGKGCTFEPGEDGKYRYGLWTDDLGLTLAVDSQELQKTRRRLEPMLGLLLTFHYRGAASLYLKTNTITLEFVNHQHVVHGALDPETLSAQLQAGADELEDQAQKDSRKHPEKFQEKEKLLQAYQKQVAEMLEFLSTRSLRPLTLDSETGDTNGWLFFSSKGKWIGSWKKQESFVLRIPMENYVLEIPFSLPPSNGELLLRKRPE